MADSIFYFQFFTIIETIFIKNKVINSSDNENKKNLNKKITVIRISDIT